MCIRYTLRSILSQFMREFRDEEVRGGPVGQEHPPPPHQTLLVDSLTPPHPPTPPPPQPPS